MATWMFSGKACTCSVEKNESVTITYPRINHLQKNLLASQSRTRVHSFINHESMQNKSGQVKMYDSYKMSSKLFTSFLSALNGDLESFKAVMDNSTDMETLCVARSLNIEAFIGNIEELSGSLANVRGHVKVTNPSDARIQAVKLSYVKKRFQIGLDLKAPLDDDVTMKMFAAVQGDAGGVTSESVRLKEGTTRVDLSDNAVWVDIVTDLLYLFCMSYITCILSAGKLDPAIEENLSEMNDEDNLYTSCVRLLCTIDNKNVKSYIHYCDSFDAEALQLTMDLLRNKEYVNTTLSHIQRLITDGNFVYYRNKNAYIRSFRGGSNRLYNVSIFTEFTRAQRVVGVDLSKLTLIGK